MTIPGLAGAAGLGELSSLSYLGQPFRAQIELVAQDNEFSGFISPRIASPDVFRAAGLRYGPSAAGMQVTVRKPVVGPPFIEILSARTINEPAFDLLVEVDWGSTTIRRAYPVLLELPRFDAATTIPRAPVVPDVQRDSIAAIAVGPATADHGASRKPVPEPKPPVPVARSEPSRGAKSVGDAQATSGILSRLSVLEEKSVSDQKMLDGLLARAAAMEKTIRDMEQAVEVCKRCAIGAKEPDAAKPPAQGSVPPKAEVAATPEPPPTPPQDHKETAKPVAAVTRQPQHREKSGETVAATPPLVPGTGAAEFLGDLSPLYLVGGGIVIVLGGVGYWLVRRRRLSGVTSEAIVQKLLDRDPSREDLQVRLLKIFAERGDTLAYERVAKEFKAAAGTQSKNWATVVAMGRMLDPSNPLYQSAE